MHTLPLAIIVVLLALDASAETVPVAPVIIKIPFEQPGDEKIAKRAEEIAQRLSVQIANPAARSPFKSATAQGKRLLLQLNDASEGSSLEKDKANLLRAFCGRPYDGNDFVELVSLGGEVQFSQAAAGGTRSQVTLEPSNCKALPPTPEILDKIAKAAESKAAQVRASGQAVPFDSMTARVVADGVVYTLEGNEKFRKTMAEVTLQTREERFRTAAPGACASPDVTVLTAAGIPIVYRYVGGGAVYAEVTCERRRP